jgi:hypothetical protein
MHNGIHFDHDGNMARLNIGQGQFEVAFYEQIGCRKLVQIRLTPTIDIWLDAEGADNGQSENVELTRFVARYGIDYPIYGTGVIVGRDFEGDPTGLMNDEFSNIVVTHAENMLRELATAH